MLGLLKTVGTFDVQMSKVLHDEMAVSLQRQKLNECCGLNVKCPIHVHISEQLVPSWWCCSKRLWNLLGGGSLLERVGHWEYDSRI